jgi:hypothetical protein
MTLLMYAKSRSDNLMMEVRKLEAMTPTWRLRKWSHQHQKVKVLTAELDELNQILERG